MVQPLDELDVYGYTTVPGFLTAAEVADYLALVESIYDPTAVYDGKPARDARDLFIYNLQNKDRRFIDLLGREPLPSILGAKLNDPNRAAPNYVLAYYNARSSGTPLELHIDSYIPKPGPRTWSIQVAVPLVDHTLDNGCTTFVPGSHLSDEFSNRGLERVEPLLSKAGDLVLWDSRLWHGTRENISGSHRWTLVATFNMWWLKQTMDIPRGMPAHMAATLTPDEARLMGFEPAP